MWRGGNVLRTILRSQGVQTSFYESTPSPTNSLGDQISTESTGNFGHAGTNFPYAPKERDNGGASRLTRVLLKRIPGKKSFRRVVSSYRSKESERPHPRTLFPYVHDKLCVLSSVEKGDYAFKIDLQDAYFHVQIHPSSRKYLRFAFENRVYQFRVLPFGLNTAPQIFTRLGHTVTAYLHRQGISVIPYLDDWLIHHPDRQVLLRHQALLLDTLPCRFHSESKEIRTGPDSGSPVPRNSTLGPRESFTPGVQSWGDSCLRTPSILPQGTKLHSSVPASGITQLASGLIPLGRLYLRPLQRHFHSLGLTDRFTPPRRSDPLVVPAPRDRESYLQGLGDTRSRHVYDTVELPHSSVHVSSSGPKSPSGGCSVSRLAGEVNVHVSPIPPAQQGHAEATVHSGGGGDPCSPLVAVSVVVSTSTTSLCGTPPGSPLPLGSSVPAGSEVHLRRKVVPSACMEALMLHYKAAGFSDEVSRLAAAPRRPSTNRSVYSMYDDRWRRFTRWAAGQGFDPLDPTAAQIA